MKRILLAALAVGLTGVASVTVLAQPGVQQKAAPAPLEGARRGAGWRTG